MRKIRKQLPFLLLILAIFLLVSFGFGSVILRNSETKLAPQDIVNQESTLRNQESKNTKAIFDQSQVTPVTPDQYAKAQLKYTEIVDQWGIGAIYIPSANIQSKILAGMSNENLSVGVGTYYPDQQLGKRNFVAMAHNLVSGGGVLRDLPNTQINSKIYATDFNAVFEYVATLNIKAKESDGKYIEEPKSDEKAYITLFRCEGGEGTLDRSLLQGEFLKQYPADQATNEVKTGLGLVAVAATENSDQEVSSTEAAHSQQMQKIKLAEDPSYNLLERAAIFIFALVNEHIWLITAAFPIGFFITLKIRKGVIA